MTDLIQIDINGPVMTLRINRPDKKNALTRAMYTTLSEGLEQAAQNPKVRVVVLTGVPGVFTSGNDLGDFLANPPSGEDSPVARFLKAISTFPKPLIAAVSGIAIGVGATMLLHCDLVYAADDATLQFNFANIALVPEAASSLLLPQRVGMARAAELFYFAAPFNAQTALADGLVNAVLPAADLEAFAQKQAQALAGQPASALRQTKALLRYSKTTTVPERMAEEGTLFAKRLQSPEAIEAMSAFMQKRKPDFSQFD